jgi:hypothetical protein
LPEPSNPPFYFPPTGRIGVSGTDGAIAYGFVTEAGLNGLPYGLKGLVMLVGLNGLPYGPNGLLVLFGAYGLADS